ncbi:MAG: hypothetical protein JO303_10905 [Caulobacteraceae bacterium]|nr:hypothetical protein [Caulobacteraceae bacterium]
MDSLPAIIATVGRGAASTVLPYSAVAEAVGEGRLAVWPLESPALTRELMLVRPVQRRPTAAATAVEQEIRRLLAELAPQMRWRPLAAPPRHGEPRPIADT